MPTLKRLLPPAFVVLLAIAVGAANPKLFSDSDMGHYLRLAAGASVPQPFAARQLASLVVRGLTHLGLSIHQGFWLLGIVSLVFFVGSSAYFLDKTRSPAWLRWSMLGLYFWPLAFCGMVLPDLCYSALLCGFLLLVWEGRYGWAAAMLFPLMMARESTVLVLLCWLIVGWRTVYLSRKLGAVAAVVCGGLVVRWLSAGSGGNREGLAPLLYLIGKIPWNFAKNFLGLEPWANLNTACGVPTWHHALHLGPLSDIGYCGFAPEYPIRLVAYALATFGLLPLLLWWLRKASAPGLLERFCLLYGITSYLTAGLLGYSVQRLYGYGWPAALVALPLLEHTGDFRDRRWAVSFVSLSLLANWMEFRLDKLPLLLAELVLWSLGVLVLRQGWLPGTTDAAHDTRNTPENPSRLL